MNKVELFCFIKIADFKCIYCIYYIFVYIFQIYSLSCSELIFAILNKIKEITKFFRENNCLVKKNFDIKLIFLFFVNKN